MEQGPKGVAIAVCIGLIMIISVISVFPADANEPRGDPIPHVEINSPLDYNLTGKFYYDNTPIFFDGRGSYDPAGGALSYIWTFDRLEYPPVYDKDNFTRSFKEPGWYAITLNVSNTLYFTNETSVTILVVHKIRPPRMDTDLGDSFASFWGEEAGDNCGRRVAGAGDVNGDGYDDILISARKNDESGIDAGQTYLFLGRVSGWSMDTDLSKADASFLGEDTYDQSGTSVACAGDVNGDGYDDILIGANGDEDGGINAGQTYLILGKATGWSMNTDLSDSDASFWGESVGCQSGYKTAGAGDVNGDGFDDILIGANWNDEGGTDAGQTYLILGKATGWSMDTDLSNADASFVGENPWDYSGSSIAGAGDVNGDGYDDILIGALDHTHGSTGASQTYLILGKASGWSMDTDLSNVDASFWGQDARNRNGESVAGAGDVNGDGYDDILIGARGSNDGGTFAGQTYLILGKASGWSMDTEFTNADASFWGEDAGDRSGYSVEGAGDVNGDGYDDILTSANGSADGGAYAGQTYLILGKASGWSMNTDLSNADASFIGEDAGDHSGCSVAGAGDVNGDGYDDILIGAQWNDEGGDGAGQTYLIFFKVLDTDNDGFFDYEDAFPLDIAASMDTDGDGYPTEWNEGMDQSDSTTGLMLDAFPMDVAASMDTDGDGYPDLWNEGMDQSDSTTGLRMDAFPLDIAASMDTDGDGFPNEWNEGMDQSDSTTGLRLDAVPRDVAASLDTDGDGFPDEWNEGMTGSDSTTGLRLDAFPDDKAASMDTDSDGYPDKWNPGMSSGDSTSDPKLVLDDFPSDPDEWVDTDRDGYGDNGDSFPDDPAAAVDSDGDGFPDKWNPGKSVDDSTSSPRLMLDEFPEDPLEWFDTDGDGHGDNGDVFPLNEWEWNDRDGDGYGDNEDVFPDDPLEWADVDNDGHGDNWDVFPNDPSEWLDTDEDGFGDNEDVFPEDPDEWNDIDGDGHGDNGDAFPDDPLEWIDTDDDGHGDNGDVFPDDPLEWLDTDGDTHGDSSDAFPDDPLEWLDTDGDGSGDNGDAFPEDAAASVDTDGDGHPDEWNAGKTKKDSTTGLKIDQLPNDPEEWKKPKEEPSVGLMGALMAILVAALVAYNRRMH